MTAHTQLEERISFINMFRKNHDFLVATVKKVEQSVSHKVDVTFDICLDEVQFAIEHIKSIDVLDISPGNMNTNIRGSTAMDRRREIVHRFYISC